MFFYWFIILVDEKHRNGESQDVGGELKVIGIIKYTYY